MFDNHFVVSTFINFPNNTYYIKQLDKSYDKFKKIYKADCRTRREINDINGL